ncbi:DUF732 domain-containing protein [Mycolicibacterium thermoresistibile]
MSASVLLAAPAQADQYDFIYELDGAGVWYTSTVEMIDIGKEVCHELRHGVSPGLVLGKLANTGFAPAESAIILVSAVTHMCVDAEPIVVSWLNDQGYTAPV